VSIIRDNSPVRPPKRSLRRVGSASAKLRAASKSRIKKRLDSRQRRIKGAKEVEIDELAELIATFDKERDT
jgi:hypothetical protein